MDCFCNREIHKRVNLKILLDDFSDVSPGNKIKYCRKWFVNFYKLKLFTILNMVFVFIINFIVGMIYEALGPFSKFKTVNSETQSIYFKTLVFSFLDFALIPILL